MTKKYGWVAFTLIIVFTLILAACAQATPEPEEVVEEPAAPAEEEEMPLAGETVTIFTAAADEQAAAFQSEFDNFTAETGIEVVVEGSGDFEVLATTRAEAGDLPDIINFPQPGLMADMARDGHLIDLSTFLSNDYLLQQYDQSWIDQGTVDGTLVGIWHNADVKSLVWYPKAAFEAAGYTVEVPEAQTCCGQPAFNNGDFDTTRDIAKKVEEIAVILNNKSKVYLKELNYLRLNLIRDLLYLPLKPLTFYHLPSTLHPVP